MKTVLCVAGIAVLMMAAVSQAGVLYQSDFTGTTVADAGLTSGGANSGIWNIDTVNDRLNFSAPYSTSRATVKNTGGFQSDHGITLDVTFNQLGSANKFSIGLADVSTGAWNNGNDFIQDNTVNAPYSIALSTDGALEDANGNKDVLSFYDGSTVSKLSDAQGDITFGADTRLVLTVTADSWSYSLNGATATTGSFTFDTSKSYMFVAYGNRGTAAAGSYISNITLTSPPTGTVISIQ
jgi:hypothetical protein